MDNSLDVIHQPAGFAFAQAILWVVTNQAQSKYYSAEVSLFIYVTGFRILSEEKDVTAQKLIRGAPNWPKVTINAWGGLMMMINATVVN